MKGSEARLLEYMEGSKKRFVIPVYQRSYDWKLENCKQLFDDLVTVVRTKRTSHFFGSIVSAYQPNGRYTEYLVIDGQQRLTTVSLLLLAMYNLLRQGRLTASAETMAQEIYEEARALGAQIAASSVRVSIKTGEGGKIFGSVSSKEISQAASEQLGLDIDKKKMQLPSPLKSLGTHMVPVKLHPKVTVELKVVVTEA